MNHPFQTLTWTVVDRIGLLQPASPPSNSMSVSFFGEMSRIREMIRIDSGLKAVLIEGTGRHYSAGVNLETFLPEVTMRKTNSDPDTLPHNFLLSNYQSISFFETLSIPVISVIRGVCIGSGFELALFSHFRFCSEEAVFGLPECSFNLIPGLGGIRRFASIAGKAPALEYILSGRTFNAATAYTLGLVDLIVPKRELSSMAHTFARWLPEPFSPALKPVYLNRMQQIPIT